MLWEIREIVNGSISSVTHWAIERSIAQFLPSVLVFLEHVLDGGFVDHQVRSTVYAHHLDAGLVVPLDDAMYFLAVAQHDHHRRLRLHLLLIVEILRVGLLWRRCLARASRPRPAVVPFEPALPATFRAVVPFGTFPPFGELHLIWVVIAVVVIPARQRR